MGMGDAKGEVGTLASTSFVSELAGESIDAVLLLDGIVRDATVSLFASYGLIIAPGPSAPPRAVHPVQMLSTIGFSSEALSGSLSLVLPEAVVTSVRPTPNANLEDWSGELVNQLLGRLKNQLLSYQIAIHMGLPVVVTAGGACLPMSPHQVTRLHEFASDVGPVFVRLDMEMSPTLELVTPSPGAEQAHMDEGELVLF